MKLKKANVLLVGCGPHAKRVYVPALKILENKYNTEIKGVVDLKGREKDTSDFMSAFYPSAEGVYINPFTKDFKDSLPPHLEKTLNRLVLEKEISGIIIATDPLNHMQYALWAQKMGLHILMDKPISTYENISNSVEQAKQIKDDFHVLMKNKSNSKAFIVNAQRRFLPQFKIIEDKVNEIARNYGMPITSMQSTHSDGQWRLPKEVLEIPYHPHIGWGKVSHSGYHFIDMASKLVKDSFIAAGKKIDSLSVYSKFIRPQGILKQQSQEDLAKIFGKEYRKLDSRSDEELVNLYKLNNEAEVDANSLVSFSQNDIPVSNITLNLIHNGFSRRSWMLPKENLYKGNGRLRHEYHNILQGPLQNIQVHSYQSKDKHDINTEDDFGVGGNNHYDILLFRNVDIVGGKPVEVITAKDVAENSSLDISKVMNELARHEVVKEFIEIMLGLKKASDSKSNLEDHYLSAQLMSMIYESGIKNSEIIQSIDNFK